MSLRYFLPGQPEAMRLAGFDVHAVSSPGLDLVEFGRDERVHTHEIRMTRRITPLRDLIAVAKLYRTFRRIRPEIVHAHTPKGGLLGMLAARLARVPVRIYHIHGLAFVTRRGLKRRLLRWTEQVASRCATRVLCVSRSIREVVIEERITNRDPIVLLGGSINGVDARSRFSPDLKPVHRARVRKAHGIADDALVIGYVGRVVRDKGLVELTAAWEALSYAIPQAHLLIVGPFEAEDPVPRDVERSLREHPRVHLHGIDWETPPLYSAMDVVVLPSYREGLPFVPLEAAAMELPVVATRIPGCVDAVRDGVTGTLVEPRDPDALARAIRQYIENEALARAHGRAGRAWVLREFDQSRVWAALSRHYGEALAEMGSTIGLQRDTSAEATTRDH
ncbi:glycosyltransferase family 4 protein [Anaeromyxobacter oryzae]|uniref:Glycosyl transferase n=1 Tax=Anaeromyxobacter oryzae TaxID=2918170 RepID=A0ABM7WV91_9BACT|nr:glycosyltransferase family 4 protein [Anaeromyxobacter oryzae]BDG03435.1 glycosyl transferase [Anaeromyxobacter oryzae]